MRAGCATLTWRSSFVAVAVAAPLAVVAADAGLAGAAGAVAAALRAGCPALLCGTDDDDETSPHDGHSFHPVQECHLSEAGCPALPPVHESHPEDEPCHQAIAWLRAESLREPRVIGVG